MKKALRVFHKRVFSKNGKTRFSQKYYPETIFSGKKIRKPNLTSPSGLGPVRLIIQA